MLDKTRLAATPIEAAPELMRLTHPTVTSAISARSKSVTNSPTSLSVKARTSYQVSRWLMTTWSLRDGEIPFWMMKSEPPYFRTRQRQSPTLRGIPRLVRSFYRTQRSDSCGLCASAPFLVENSGAGPKMSRQASARSAVMLD